MHFINLFLSILINLSDLCLQLLHPLLACLEVPVQLTQRLLYLLHILPELSLQLLVELVEVLCGLRLDRPLLAASLLRVLIHRLGHLVERLLELIVHLRLRDLLEYLVHDPLDLLLIQPLLGPPQGLPHLLQLRVHYLVHVRLEVLLARLRISHRLLNVLQVSLQLRIEDLVEALETPVHLVEDRGVRV